MENSYGKRESERKPCQWLDGSSKQVSCEQRRGSMSRDKLPPFSSYFVFMPYILFVINFVHFLNFQVQFLLNKKKLFKKILSSTGRAFYQNLEVLPKEILVEVENSNLAAQKHTVSFFPELSLILLVRARIRSLLPGPLIDGKSCISVRLPLITSHLYAISVIFSQ